MVNTLERSALDIKKASESLNSKLIELEELVDYLIKSGGRAGSGIKDYEEAMGLLTIEKSDLEQQLLKKSEEYAELRKAAIFVAKTLKQSIDSINVFLKSQDGN